MTDIDYKKTIAIDHSISYAMVALDMLKQALVAQVKTAKIETPVHFTLVTNVFETALAKYGYRVVEDDE